MEEEASVSEAGTPPSSERPMEEQPSEFSFSYEAALHETFPAVHEAHSAWMSQIDDLTSPDRKTHELIRLVCMVILRHQPGIERHARLAREVGATWEEVLGSILLTCPGFGTASAVAAIPSARIGFETAPEVEEDDE
jgi:alkylhydroperoxidase/carboxymuconolactone decarboxylase family protein YurZ